MFPPLHITISLSCTHYTCPIYDSPHNLVNYSYYNVIPPLHITMPSMLS